VQAIVDAIVELEWEIARDYSIDGYMELLNSPKDLESFTAGWVEQSIDDISQKAYEIVCDYCDSGACNLKLVVLLNDRTLAEFVIYDILNNDRSRIAAALRTEAKRIIKGRAYGTYDRRHHCAFWDEEYI